jgi:hypothetical protein
MRTVCVFYAGALLVFADYAGPVDTGAVIRFRDVIQGSGINFVLENSPTDRKHLLETMPGGIAAFDYDGDGPSDIYFTNGAALPSLEKNSPKYQNRLYRNLGGFKFKDVTEEAGVQGSGYSMAAAEAITTMTGRRSVCRWSGQTHPVPQPGRWHVRRRDSESRDHEQCLVDRRSLV